MATLYNVNFVQEGIIDNIILYCADNDYTTIIFSIRIFKDECRNLIVMKVNEERVYGASNIIKHEYDIHVYDGTRKEIQSEIDWILTDILSINKESAYSHDKFKSFIDEIIDDIISNYIYELTHLVIDIKHAEKMSALHNFHNDIADIKKTDNLHVKLPPDFDFESDFCLTYPNGSFEFEITSDIADALCKKYPAFLRRNTKNKTFVMIPADNIYTPGPGYYYSFKKPKPKKIIIKI